MGNDDFTSPLTSSFPLSLTPSVRFIGPDTGKPNLS